MDHAITDPGLIDPNSESVRVWIVWSVMDSGAALSGIALTQALAERFRTRLLQEDAPRRLRVTIEASYANHLYGGSMGGAPPPRPRSGD